MTAVGLNYTMVICGQRGELGHRYRPLTLEKVKFGLPIHKAFAHDIPATLLVLMLKANKEGPQKKDIWRAPGNQAQVKKLQSIMQNGRLVNIANFSVYTAASVIKKFFAKLPGGIFGIENEERLFAIAEQEETEKQREIFCRVVSSLPLASQHLLVLLFGTFRMIADANEAGGTRMNAEAIGVSVAPSLFHSCILDGQRAKIEDVVRFRVASEVLAKIIKNFGYANLFPRENYEWYARITGRTLRVDENLLFSFLYPSKAFSQPDVAANTAGKGEQGTSGLVISRRVTHHDIIIHERHHPIPRSPCAERTGRTFPSASVGEVHLLPTLRSQCTAVQNGQTENGDTFPVLHNQEQQSGSKKWFKGGRLAESTQSLSYLEWVHERQMKRMHNRTDWFLSPVLLSKNSTATKSLASGEFPIIHSTNLHPDASSSNVNAQGQKWCLKSGACYPLTNNSTPTGSGVKVVRKRSWRTHYVRPKSTSTDQISSGAASQSDHEEVTRDTSSAATPLTPRGSPIDEEMGTEKDIQITPRQEKDDIPKSEDTSEITSEESAAAAKRIFQF